MKTKLYITSVFIFFFSIFFVLTKEVKAGNFTCTWLRGGAVGSYSEECRGPDWTGDAINIGSSLGYCQEYQDDHGYGNYCPGTNVTPPPNPKAGQTVIWKSMGPRGYTCTDTFNFCKMKGTCSCSDGSVCNVDTGLHNTPEWNYNECSRCTTPQVSITPDYGAKTVTIGSITAVNYRPLLHSICTGNCGKANATYDSKITYPDSNLDFRVKLVDSATGAVIATKDIYGTNPLPSNMNCMYATGDSYTSRDNQLHYVSCTMTGTTFTNVTLVPGKTYKVSTVIRPHYGTESSWIDYIPDGTPTGKNYQVCGNQFTAPTITPTLTPTITPTLTPTPTIMSALMCQSLSHATSNPPHFGDRVDLTCTAVANNTTPHHYNFRYTSNAGQTWSYINNILPSANIFVAYANYNIGAYGHFTNQCQVCRQYRDPGDNSIITECTPWGLANVTLPPPVTAVPPTVTPTPNTPYQPSPTVTAAPAGCPAGQTKPYRVMKNGTCYTIQACGLSQASCLEVTVPPLQ